MDQTYLHLLDVDPWVAAQINRWWFSCANTPLSWSKLVMYLLMISSSYKAGKVDEGNSLRIFSPHTIAVGMSNVDVHIETLGNIGRILNINIQMTKSMSIYFHSSQEDWSSAWGRASALRAPCPPPPPCSPSRSGSPSPCSTRQRRYQRWHSYTSRGCSLP